MRVTDYCKDYFDGLRKIPSDIWNGKAIALLKIVSIALLCPLFIGVAYGIASLASLCERVKKEPLPEVASRVDGFNPTRSANQETTTKNADQVSGNCVTSPAPDTNRVDKLNPGETTPELQKQFDMLMYTWFRKVFFRINSQSGEKADWKRFFKESENDINEFTKSHPKFSASLPTEEQQAKFVGTILARKLNAKQTVEYVNIGALQSLMKEHKLLSEQASVSLEWVYLHQKS